MGVRRRYENSGHKISSCYAVGHHVWGAVGVVCCYLASRIPNPPAGCHCSATRRANRGWLAAAQGNPNAKDYAPLLELELSANQIAKGKRLADHFKPQERTQP